MLKRNIRSQVLVPLTLTFIIITGSFVYASYRIRMDDYERGLVNRYQRLQHVLKGFIDDRTLFMTTAVEYISEQTDFQDAMRTKDREALLKLGSPILKLLFKQQQITHFYFYDKNGAIVLRVYNPRDISLNTPRFSLQQAMAQGNAVSGLELGHSGTFTLRVVYPWKIDGEVLGYIELGQEYDQILKDLKAVSLIDFAVLLDKKHLVREAWEEGIRIAGRNPDWDFLPDRVLIDQTVSLSSAAFKTLFAAGPDARKYGRKLEVKGRAYRVKSFPMQDAALKNVGEFVVFTDQTADIESFRLFIAQVVSFSIVLCVGLFTYSYRVLTGVDSRLQEYRSQLVTEFEKQAATNKLLEREVQERRRAEENLVSLNEHLEHRVMDRTSKLEEAYSNLQTQQTTILQQDRMACIGQLAASVAHDINNPIGFVSGNLVVLKNYWMKLADFVRFQQDTLQSCVAPALMKRVKERRLALKVDSMLDQYDTVIDESLEGTERVNRIVLNLKGFSRQDTGEARLANIHDCLESTLNIVMNELRYKADIIRDFGEIPLLMCNPQQLDQVFMNLLINASQAIEQWGRITITTRADEDNIYVAIADTGCGIATENLPKLFEPFYTSKEVGVGTGLGLPIVRDIVKTHHGEIRVESSPGKGAVFTVRFPLGVLPEEAGHA